ncbi:MAG TPA: lipopolysaccharide biosynthesis protein [Polyangia bacterium]
MISAVLTFALPLILARLLTPTSFGTYKQFFLIASTIQLTAQLGLTQSLYYFLPRGERDRGAYLAQAMMSLAALGALFGAGLWLMMPFVGHWLGDGSLVAARTPLALFAALMLAAAPLEGALTSEGRIRTAALTYVINDGTRGLAFVVGAHYGGAIGLFWAAVLTALARIVALGGLATARVLPVQRPRLALFKKQLVYALPFAGAMYLYVGQRYFSQYAVSASFDAATFALFAVASFHLPVVEIVFGPLSEVMMVHLGRAQHQRDAVATRAAWNATVRRLATILFPATIAAWIFGPTVLPLLFTSKYNASVPLFMLATFEIPLWILPLDALLRAAGETRFLFVFYAARVLLTSTLVILGIKLFGLGGAIVAGVISEAVARAGMALRARHFLQIPMRRICDWRSLFATAMAAVTAAGPAIALRHLPLAALPRIAIAGVAYASIYAGILIALRYRNRYVPAGVAAVSGSRW